MQFTLLLLFCCLPTCIWTYNIALHAQVYPNNGEKVVGSVITTDGLKAAFLRRKDVHHCEIFYPGHYQNFTIVTWDFLIIEGWFLSIHEFLQIARNLHPEIKIFFYCLDPVYPGMQKVLQFNVDGIITNSLLLKSMIQSFNISSEFIMLAADPNIMKPNHSIARDYGAVYVGAGSHMLLQKPELREMLLDAIPFKLRLNGVGWENVNGLSSISLGPLARNELANAYASARLVLAATIKSQDEMFMINNRIFEALSCGAIVVTQFSPILQHYFPDIIQFRTNTTSFKQIYQNLLTATADEHLEKLRNHSREIVLKYHTWDHRAIQFMSFMKHIKYSSVLKPNNPLRLLWVESKESFSDLDYQFLKNNFLFSYLSKRFKIDLIDEETFIHDYSLPSCFLNQSSAEENHLDSYHIVFGIIEPFSDLDNLFQNLPVLLQVNDLRHIQRRMVYVTGVNYHRIEKCKIEEKCHSFSHYDVVLFRDFYEMELLANLTGNTINEVRKQHLFGIPLHRHAHQTMEANTSLPMIVCPIKYQQLCDEGWRLNIAGQYYPFTQEHLLVLLDGNFEDWVTPNLNILGSQPLGNIIHIEKNRLNLDFFQLMNQSSAVIIVQFEDPTAPPGQHTIGDSILPLLAGALLSKPLYLSHLNHHIVNLGSQACETWDLNYLLNSTTNALNRLLGFPPVSANYSIRQLNFPLENYCSSCNENDLKILQNCEALSHQTSWFTVVAFENVNFDWGRDGQICLNQIPGTEESIICLQRTSDYVVIESNSLVNMASFKFLLRGSHFGDATLRREYSFHFFPPWNSYNEKDFSPFERNVTFDKDVDCRILRYQLLKQT